MENDDISEAESLVPIEFRLIYRNMNDGEKRKEGYDLTYVRTTKMALREGDLCYVVYKKEERPRLLLIVDNEISVNGRWTARTTRNRLINGFQLDSVDRIKYELIFERFFNRRFVTYSEKTALKLFFGNIKYRTLIIKSVDVAVLKLVEIKRDLLLGSRKNRYGR
jgi:hypothetical protein